MMIRITIVMVIRRLTENSGMFMAILLSAAGRGLDRRALPEAGLAFDYHGIAGLQAGDDFVGLLSLNADLDRHLVGLGLAHDVHVVALFVLQQGCCRHTQGLFAGRQHHAGAGGHAASEPEV